MATVSMESLWNFLNSISLSRQNKLWLAKHLMDDTKVNKDEVTDDKYTIWGPADEEEAVDAVMAAEKEIESGDVEPIEELLKETYKKIGYEH